MAGLKCSTLKKGKLLMRFRQFAAAVLILYVLAVTALPAFSDQGDLVSDDELQPLLEKIETNFSTINTLKTMLSQEKQIPVFSEKVISKGFCMFKSPDKLRLEFTEPFKSCLIVDGNRVFKYEYLNGAWKKLTIGNKDILLMVMGNIASWLKGHFKDGQIYDLSAWKKETLVIKLTPKSDEFKRFISSFELGLNPDLDTLDYIVINEGKQSTTRIQFYNDMQNVDIPDSIFEGNKNEPVPVSKW